MAQYSVDDDVTMRGDSDDMLWVGRISHLDETTGTMAVRWYYSKPDVPAAHLRKLEQRFKIKLQPNEMFATEHSDFNSIASILRKCTVSADVADNRVRVAAPWCLFQATLSQQSPPSPRAPPRTRIV